MLLYLTILTFVYFISADPISTSVSTPKYSTEYSTTDLMWIYIEYDFEVHGRKEWLMKEGIYVKESPYILDIDAWRSGQDGKKVLIAVNMPRKSGVPATLAVVSHIVVDGGPVLQAFPNWSYHNVTHPTCSSTIINSCSTVSDQLENHWTFDSGMVEGKRICSPKIMSFDSFGKLLEFREIKETDIEKSSFGDSSLVSYIAVENDRGQSGKFHVYLSGMAPNEMIIYNGDKVWTVKSEYFKSNDLKTKLSEIEKNFGLKWEIGAFALTPEKKGEERKLFLRSIASRDILSIPTSQLHESFDPTKPVKFEQHKNIFSSPVMSMAFSEKGILFAALPEEGAICCWNMKRPLTAENIVILEKREGEYVTAISIIPDRVTGKGEKLYFVWNRKRKSTDNKKHTNQNIEIFDITIDDKIEKICEGPEPTKSPEKIEGVANLVAAEKIPPTHAKQESNSCGNFFKWVSQILCMPFRILRCIFVFKQS